MDIFQSPRSLGEMTLFWINVSHFRIKLNDFYESYDKGVEVRRLEIQLQDGFNRFNKYFDESSIAAIDYDLDRLKKLTPNILKQDPDYIEILEFFQECKDFRKNQTIEQAKARVAFNTIGNYSISILGVISDKSNVSFTAPVVIKLKEKLQQCRREINEMSDEVAQLNRNHMAFAKTLRNLSDTCDLIATYTPVDLSYHQDLVNSHISDYEVQLIAGGI